MYAVRQTEDLEAVMAMDRVCFPHDAVKDMGDGELWTVSTDDGELAGYGSLVVQDNGAKAFLSRSGVLKPHRGNGLQKRLIRARISWCRRHAIPRVWTYVAIWNLASLKSLCATGFLPYHYERVQTMTPGVKMTVLYLELKLCKNESLQRTRKTG